MEELSDSINGNEVFDSKLRLPENPHWVPKEQNLGQFIIKHMKRNKIKIALIEASTGNFVNYETFLSQIISTAKEMMNQGIVRNDVISMCSANSMLNTIPLFASFLIGAVPASLDPTLALDETVHLLKLVQPKIIFVEPTSVSLMEEAIELSEISSKIVILGYSHNNVHTAFSTYLTESDSIDEDFEPDMNDTLEDIAMILFSSGSTGLPKGICLTHYGVMYQVNMISGVRLMKKRVIRPTDRSLNFASPYWISTILSILTAVLKGDARIIVSKFEPESFFKNIQVYKITTMSLSTAVSFLVAQNMDHSKKFKNTSLKFISVAGGYMSDDHLHFLRKLFPTALVLNVYGMTEISGATLMFNPFTDFELIKVKGKSVGRPLPGIWLKLLDVGTKEPVGPNQHGELRIKGKCMLKTYYENEEEFTKQFDDDGFLLTGDVAYYDDDNCFYIVDRIKEMMKFQSWHVTPAAIEAVLLTHPNVKEAMVTGIPHPVDENHPVAIIVTKQNTLVTEDELVQYIEDRMADKYHLRGGVRFIESLPKTPTGKVRRLLVREMVRNV